MDERQFWQLIDSAKSKSRDGIDSRMDALRFELLALSSDEIQSFQDHYDDNIHRAYRWDLLGAACVINGGCSDDLFRYFRDWLISEGSETYERAMNDPESLAELGRDCSDLELFGYVALEVYEDKCGGELNRRFTLELDDLQGESWDNDDLPNLFPRLSEIYAEKT